MKKGVDLGEKNNRSGNRKSRSVVQGHFSCREATGGDDCDGGGEKPPEVAEVRERESLSL